MSDSILQEIWRVREELIQKHGGWEGYFQYVQKLDRAHRQHRRPQKGKKARPPNARTIRGRS